MYGDTSTNLGQDSRSTHQHFNTSTLQHFNKYFYICPGFVYTYPRFKLKKP